MTGQSAKKTTWKYFFPGKSGNLPWRIYTQHPDHIETIFHLEGAGDVKKLAA